MNKDNPLKDRRAKSLTYSIKDGTAFSVMTGFGEQYFIPLAIELGATNMAISFIASVPLFIAALIQLYTSRLMKKYKSRRKMLSTFIFLQALIWIPLTAIPFFGQRNHIETLLFFIIIYFSLGQFVAPVWNSIMGDLVNENIRGRFFGQRNKITGAAAFASLFIAGYILSLFAKENILHGFALIFFIACIARIISWYYIGRMDDPEMKEGSEEKFSFLEYLRKLKDTNYGRFALYYGFMNFAVYVAAPFFAVYMLRDLHFTYLDYTLVTAAGALATFLPMTYWGKLSDRFGNKKILSFCGIGMTGIPILWLFSDNLLYLIILQIYSGFVWSGFNLSTVNFVYDNVRPGNRTKIFAYHNVLTGTFIFLGSLFGAFVAMEVTTPLFPMSNLLLLFLLSGILRALAAGIFLPHIKEKRMVEDISDREFFIKYNGTRPFMGMTFRAVTGLRKTIKGKKYDIMG